MMNSRWARFMGVAVGVIAAGLASCAEAPSSDGQKLHVAASPADFAALGIGQKIAIWEDGRRTPKSADTFEWWYFDGLLDDGTVVVVWFGDNWFYGSHNRAVTIELTPQASRPDASCALSKSRVHSRVIVRTSKLGLISSKATSIPISSMWIRRRPAE